MARFLTNGLPSSPAGEQPTGIDELIAEAEELRRLVHGANGQLARLIVALKQHRRQSRIVAAAMASLQKLRLNE